MICPHPPHLLNPAGFSLAAIHPIPNPATGSAACLRLLHQAVSRSAGPSSVINHPHSPHHLKQPSLPGPGGDAAWSPRPSPPQPPGVQASCGERTLGGRQPPRPRCNLGTCHLALKDIKMKALPPDSNSHDSQSCPRRKEARQWREPATERELIKAR